MSGDAFIVVKRPKRGVGKRCMHCNKPATTTAVRKANGHRRAVRYCDDHAELIIGIGVAGERTTWTRQWQRRS